MKDGVPQCPTPLEKKGKRHHSILFERDGLFPTLVSSISVLVGLWKDAEFTQVSWSCWSHRPGQPRAVVAQIDASLYNPRLLSHCLPQSTSKYLKISQNISKYLQYASFKLHHHAVFHGTPHSNASSGSSRHHRTWSRFLLGAIGRNYTRGAGPALWERPIQM